MRLLNDYGLIISIKTNKVAYVCVCFIFKIGDATSTRIYFPISVQASGKKIPVLLVSPILKIKAYEPISFFVYPIKMNRKAYVCVWFIFKIRDATSIQIYFPSLVHALKWKSKYACS